jgi:hypothetical protein
MTQEGNAAGEIKGAKSVEERADEDAGSKGPANGMPSTTATSPGSGVSWVLWI